MSKSKNKSKKTEENKIEEKVIEKTQETVASETVEEEGPPEPKTNKERFLSIFNKFGDLFVLNVVFFATCIPIITIGPAFVALYTVTNKMVKNTEGPIVQEYYKAFKANLKPGIFIWLFDLVYIIFMYVQYAYVLLNSNQASKVLFIAVGAEFFLFAFAFPLQFPLVARYENTTFNQVKNALILAFANLGVWFKMFFIWMFPVALYYLKPNFLVYTWYLWAMILTALFAYVCSMLLEGFYEKLEAPKA